VISFMIAGWNIILSEEKIRKEKRDPDQIIVSIPKPPSGEGNKQGDKTRP
jgi:hypothetical protein